MRKKVRENKKNQILVRMDGRTRTMATGRKLHTAKKINSKLVNGMNDYFPKILDKERKYIFLKNKSRLIPLYICIY